MGKGCDVDLNFRQDAHIDTSYGRMPASEIAGKILSEAATPPIGQELNNPCPGLHIHREIAVIYNPGGGSFRRKNLEKFKATCKSLGADVDCLSTKDVDPQTGKKAKHFAERLAEAAAESGKYDTIIGWGGDGTVSKVISGVHKAELAGYDVPPVATYQGGTHNVFSRTLGLPRHPVDFAKAVVSEKRKTERVDLLEISYLDKQGDKKQQDIIAEVGVGPIPNSIHEAPERVKKLLGPAYQGIYFLKALLARAPRHFELETDDHNIHLPYSRSAFVVNTGGPSFERWVPKCTVTDRKADIINFPKTSIIDLDRIVLRKLLHRPTTDLYQYVQTDKPILITTTDHKKFIFDADGDKKGPTKWIKVSLEPQALNVVAK